MAKPRGGTSSNTKRPKPKVVPARPWSTIPSTTKVVKGRSVNVRMSRADAQEANLKGHAQGTLNRPKSLAQRKREYSSRPLGWDEMGIPWHQDRGPLNRKADQAPPRRWLGPPRDKGRVLPLPPQRRGDPKYYVAPKNRPRSA